MQIRTIAILVIGIEKVVMGSNVMWAFPHLQLQWRLEDALLNHLVQQLHSSFDHQLAFILQAVNGCSGARPP